MLLAYGLLIVGCLGSASYAQTEVAVPQNRTELYEKACDEIDGIRSDFRFYMILYKNLITEVQEKHPNSNFCRELLREMFNIFKCILDLANEMDEKKSILLDTGIPNARDQFRRCLEEWLMKVQEKQSDLFRLAWELREKDSDVPLDLVDRFDQLNVQCIDVVQQGLINLLLGEVEFAIPLLPQDFVLVWHSPIPDICEKIAIMKRQCRRMMRQFWSLRKMLQENGLSGPNYPNDEMNRLCICIIEYCRCIEQLIQICQQANNLTPEQLEKAICEWLMKIKDIRNKLISYWEDLVEAITENVNEVGGRNLIKFWRKKLRNSRFWKIWTRVDDCIFKIECYYINIVLGTTPIIRPV